MNFPAIAALVLMTATTMGCCSSGNCVSSSDPCARDLAGGGFSGLFQHKCGKCKPMKGDCGCGGAMPMGCATGQCGAVATAAPEGCGCGQPHGMPSFAPPPPPAQPAPVPFTTPAPVPPVSPAPDFTTSAAPAPAPMRTLGSVAAAQPQMVTYEEFQRLPGVVISAPAAPTPVPVPVSAPAPTAVPALAPVPVPASQAIAPASWVPRQ